MKTILLLLACCCPLFGAPPSTPATNSPASDPRAKIRVGIPSGPHVHGVFNGRTPCQETRRLMNESPNEACNKIKWRLVLYQDPVTRAPTTYSIGFFHPARTGKWRIIKGTRADLQATVYQLDLADPQGFLSFLSIDDNILFLLDKEGNPLVGNIHHSYTLNRVVN